MHVQVVQYAALLGPWPTHVPDGNMGRQPGSMLHNGASPPAAKLNSTVLLQVGFNSSAGDSSNSAGADVIDDPAALYRSILHPQVLRSAAATNHSAVQHIAAVSGQHKPHPARVERGGDDDPSSPTGQLLLWYFLGLASVQPLVLWLQAAALAVVLNVLRHMPEQQLQFLLSRAAAATAGSEEGPAVDQEGMGSQQVQLGSGQSSGLGQQRPQAFLPLSYEWRAQWTLLDWLRFRLMKHSLDIVLVSDGY